MYQKERQILRQLKDNNCVVNSVSKKKNTVYAKRDGETNAEAFSQQVKAAMNEDSRIVVTIVNSGVKNGQAWVKFMINANDSLVESRNLMSGEKILIPASEKGGCCDPGTETYWSM